MKVKKRNGKIQGFNYLKIAKALYRARVDANEEKDLESCVQEAKSIIELFPQNEKTLSIEDIQDAIEKYLIKNDEIEVFKLFTFYREKRKQDRLSP